jgi:hypothetical protein
MVGDCRLPGQRLEGKNEGTPGAADRWQLKKIAGDDELRRASACECESRWTMARRAWMPPKGTCGCLRMLRAIASSFSNVDPSNNETEGRRRHRRSV